MTPHNFGKTCADCANHHMVNGDDACNVTGKRITQTKWAIIYEVGCASHTFPNPHSSPPAAPLNNRIIPKNRPKTCGDLDCIKICRRYIDQNKNIIRNQMLKELQTFIDDADNREGCPLGTISVAKLVFWMNERGYICE